MNPPLVSCIMPTADRRPFVAAAIARFLAQDYPAKELLIVDDGADAVADLVPDDPSIRYLRRESRSVLGAKRNLACDLSRGEIIVQWDDDDWYPPSRIRRQVEALLDGDADLCGSGRLYFRELGGDGAWEYRYGGPRLPWVAGSTLAFRKAFWQRNPFPSVQVGEDSAFVWNGAAGRIVDLDDPTLCIAAVHRGNTSPKRTDGLYWRPVEAGLLDALMAEGYGTPAATATAAAESAEPPRPATPASAGPALVALASGIGDVIRGTPLIRVLHRLGYEVDVLVAPDNPAAAELLAGAPEIRRLIPYPDLAANRGLVPAPELAGIDYRLAVFAYWARPLERWIRARRVLRFDQQRWLDEGDSRCVEQLARDLGWQAPLPPPLAVASSRRFGLPAGTLAIHAGCKPGWPWKKWHGFADLAARFEHVVVVGSASDADNRETYFREGFRWPDHVRDFSGSLDLRDTAALLRECAALAGNDSGLMHLGAALGVPTFGIFGITSPQREAMPVAAMHPVSKGLPCEAACRRQPWGRRDCDRHLECLKTLTAEEVAERITATVALPRRPVAAGSPSLYPSPSLPTARPASAPASAPQPLAPAPQAARRPAVSPGGPLRVAARLGGGIGDILIAAAFLRQLHAELGHCTIDVHYHGVEAARAIFHGAGFVHAVQPLAALPRAEREADLAVTVHHGVVYTPRQPVRLAERRPGFGAVLDRAAERHAAYRRMFEQHPQLDGLWGRMLTQRGIGRRAAPLFFGGIDDADPELFLAPDARAYARLDGLFGGATVPYVTVHDGFDNTHPIPAGGATKCWPIESWQALVADLKAGFPGLRVVQLGAHSSRPIPGVDHNLIEATTLQEAAWIIKHGRLHIDTDSGLVHLARALHRRSVVLFGPTDRDFFAYPENRNLIADGCSPCWWSTPDWLARCARGLAQPTCMAALTPETVAAAARPLLEAPPEPALELLASGLYTSESAAAGGATLADLFARVGLPAVPITAHAQAADSGVYLHASKQWEYPFVLGHLAAAPAGGLRIADVGGGRGALAPHLAALGHRVTVFDSDYLWDSGGDPGIESRYRDWARSRGFRAEFGSLYNLPAADESFDVVTSISVVEHVPHKIRVLQEALRVLRPGGLLLLTFDFAQDPARFEDGLRQEIFSPERLTAALAPFGAAAPFAPEAVAASAEAIAADRVLGIPTGMTVAGIALRKVVRPTRESAGA